MSDARANILARLRASRGQAAPEIPDWTAPTYGEGRLERFRAVLESVHGEVFEVTLADWPARLGAILADRGVGRVMAGPAVFSRLADEWNGAGLTVETYGGPVEDLKDDLVHRVDAGVTRAKAGIAETGSLVLWPDADEPRLLSLLPPVNVVLLDASALADNLVQVMRGQDWASAMPTNALLVSGPSKTADIEQTLAYGVHGPKELVVLVITDA
jgi:L-lactate dehydrogenase complex protein LldG